MAETLANGTVVPQGPDLINSNGVQAMRNLGSSVDAQLGNRSLVGHTHPTSAVTGLAAALAGKTNVEAVELGANADANTLTTPNRYVETNAADAATSINFPEQRAGILDVAANSDRLHVWQLWRPYTGNRMYMRSRTGGTWNAWEQIVTGTDARLTDARIPLEHQHAIGDVTGLQGALDAKARKEPVDLADQNLDDVIDEGPYVQTSSATATAARNYPANGNGLYTAGFLDVVSRPGDYLVKQYFTAFNGLDTMWRTRYAGAWNQWRRTFRADEATPVISKVTALEYDSGWRDLSGLLGAQYVSGEYWIRRVRNEVWIHFYQLVLAIESGTSVRPVWNLPIGYRPDVRYAYASFAPRTGNKPWTTPPTVGADAGGPVRISRYGVQDIYNYSAGQFISADISFLTSDAILSPPPGAAVTIF